MQTHYCRYALLSGNLNSTIGKSAAGVKMKKIKLPVFQFLHKFRSKGVAAFFVQSKFILFRHRKVGIAIGKAFDGYTFPHFCPCFIQRGGTEYYRSQSLRLLLADKMPDYTFCAAPFSKAEPADEVGDFHCFVPR